MFDLDSVRACGVEALLRWRHPSRGVLAPDEFIPSLEDTGLIVEVGRWVLTEACQQAAHWHRQGHPLTMSVNVSMRQLETDALVDHVREALVAQRTRSGLAHPGGDRDHVDARHRRHRVAVSRP